ncbi:hypothetical protein Tco_1455561 [Tanacetum coccineum]
MDSDVMLIELIKDDEYPSGDELNKDEDVGEEEFKGNHFDKFLTCSELACHKNAYDSLSNDEKENMKSVYLRNDEDKKKGVEYIMSKILGFYKECLELGPKYRAGQDEINSGTSENQNRGVTCVLMVLSPFLELLALILNYMSTLIDPPWSDLELHLSGDEFLRKKESGQFTCEMDCTTLADACGPNVDIEATLVQQSGVPPTEETSVLAIVRQEFTPPFEEGVRDQNISVSQNARRCLLPCFSAAAASDNRFPPTVEPQIQTVVAVDVRNTTNKNCIPISRVFDRFRNMRATSDQAEYMSQTASCSRPLIAVDSGNRGSVYTAAVPVSNVPKAALAGLISNNTTKNLKHTCDVLIHLFFFVITFVVTLKSTINKEQLIDPDGHGMEFWGMESYTKEDLKLREIAI